MNSTPAFVSAAVILKRLSMAMTSPRRQSAWPRFIWAIVLEKAGLITRGREAQWRPCRLDAAPLRDVANWLENYRRFWEASFDRLDAYLKDLQKGNPDEPHS
jgi:hypothetical protein